MTSIQRGHRLCPWRWQHYQCLHDCLCPLIDSAAPVLHTSSIIGMILMISFSVNMFYLLIFYKTLVSWSWFYGTNGNPTVSVNWLAAKSLQSGLLASYYFVRTNLLWLARRSWRDTDPSQEMADFHIKKKNVLFLPPSSVQLS